MISLLINSAKARQYLLTRPQAIQTGVLRAMNRIVIRLHGLILNGKLEGQVLKSHTGNLKAETLTQPAPFSEGSSIVGTVGTSKNAWYGQIHEFGGRFEIPEHMSMSRNGRAFIVRSHEAVFPERSYLRSTLRENTA